MRSASYSFSRVKLSWFWIVSACVAAIAADAASPLDAPLPRAARIASARPASDISIESFCAFSARAMWCCVTCVISCASTLASSDSDCVSRISPVWTPM